MKRVKHVPTNSGCVTSYSVWGLIALGLFAGAALVDERIGRAFDRTIAWTIALPFRVFFWLCGE